jgi:hypothetical protein
MWALQENARYQFKDEQVGPPKVFAKIESGAQAQQNPIY